MPVAMKRWLRLELPVCSMASRGWSHELGLIQSLSPIVEVVNGFQHIHFSGEEKEGWFRMWTGNVATWEDAEFCFYAKWKGFTRNMRRNVTPTPAYLLLAC